MLKSFDSSPTYLLDTNNDVNKEKQAARHFVFNNPTPAVGTSCLACGGRGKLFTSVFGVNYLRCVECLSIYADIDSATELSEKYWKDPRISEFVESYVNIKTEDFKFWLNFRALRYFGNNNNKNNITLYLDKIHSDANPAESLFAISDKMISDNLLVLSTRLGSGFETLTSGFDEERGHIFPYKYLFLPTEKGLDILLSSAGFEILELSTPGVRDIDISVGAKLDSPFLDYLINHTSDSLKMEFQAFLQKNGLSSYAKIIARKM